MINHFISSGRRSMVPLRIIDDNKNIFKFFRFFGLFPISYENGYFVCHEKVCILSRILWFLWHLAGIATIWYIRSLKRIAETIEKEISGTADSFNATSHNLYWDISDISNGTTNSIESVNDTNNCGNGTSELYVFGIYSIGILLFILVDPVQTIILKRTFNCMTKILKEVQHLENINFGNLSSQKYSVATIFINSKKNKFELNDKKCISTESTTDICNSNELIGTYKKYISTQNTTDICNSNELTGTYKKCISTESTTDICNNDELDFNTNTSQVLDLDNGDQNAIGIFAKIYRILGNIILGLSLLLFIIVFGIFFYYALRSQDNEQKHDISDEWKFFGSIFYLVFPVLTTWFCIFFLGYQNKMYRIINELPDDLFVNEEYFKDILDYLETMHHISDMLAQKIYRFTFGINFALFAMISTVSTYEMIQGLGEIRKSLTTQYGDILYIFPIAVCFFHLFLSCEYGSNLVHDEHKKLDNKLKRIMTSATIDNIETSEENGKKLKRVNILCRSFGDLHPYVTIYGGFQVDYKMFTGILLFIFTYARIFYGYNGVGED